MVDREITDKVTKQLEGMGIVIHTSAKVTAITDKAVVFEKDGKEQSVETKKVLMSVGRGPRLDGIDTEKLGLEMNRGAIVTDEHLRTNIPHVDQNDVIAVISGDSTEAEVTAPLTGVLRGMIAEGTYVTKGLKIADVDPRDMREYCFSISDKARSVAGGSLEALMHLMNTRKDR